MTMIVCWVLFPLLLGVLCLGCGLLLEQVAGVRLPGAIVPAAGLAVLIVAVHFTTLSDATAELSVPLVVALAVVGLALAPPWQRGTVDRWALGAALAVFAVFATPVVFTGDATFTGYIKLDDTATWLAITDRVMQHGRDLAGLAPSSYEATLAVNLPGGYPIGAFLPLGVGKALTGQDAAWEFQPYVAFLAAMFATTLYSVTYPLVHSRALRALVAAIASQAALLFAYSVWGGVKEVAAAWAVGLIAALVVPASVREAGARAVLPLAFASAATLAILSFGGVIWLVPLLLPALAVVAVSSGRRVALARGLAFVGFAALLAVPSLLKAEQFLRPASGTLTSDTDLGNLVKPLSWLQFFGVWPVGDFRFRPDTIDAAHALIAVVVLAGVLGLVLAWRRRATGLLVYVLGASLGCVAVTRFGSPWIDAKALATASPAFVLAGLAAGAALVERRQRIEGVVLIALIAGGVLWSNALAYKDVTVAPRDRLAELEDIGNDYAGEGPALMTDYEPYGVRHFLRKLDGEGASELRRRLVPLRSGRSLDKLEVADLDQFQLAGLLVYRTLVLRTSPVESRPPAPYGLVRKGRFYDVWQRPLATPPVIEHLPLGDALRPSAPAPCDKVLRLARLAGRHGRVAAAVRPANPIVVDLSQAPHPPDWQPSREARGSVYPGSAGTVEATVRIASPGLYSFWTGGGFRRELDLVIDGRVAATHRDELSHSGQYQPLGHKALAAGTHHIGLRYGKADLHPGSGEPPFYLGPLVLSPETGPEVIRYVLPSGARALCGRSYDWVEALSG
jgi:hypothetical protein